MECIGMWAPDLGSSILVEEALICEEEVATGRACDGSCSRCSSCALASLMAPAGPHDRRGRCASRRDHPELAPGLRLVLQVRGACEGRQHKGEALGDVLGLPPRLRSASRLGVAAGGATAIGTRRRSSGSWLRARALRIQTSLLCEDAFNCQKNKSVVKSKRRYMTPSKDSMVVLNGKAAVVVVDCGSGPVAIVRESFDGPWDPPMLAASS